MTTETVCLACRHPNRKLARLCGQCGAPLPLVELRHCTVVFCDLVGSSLLSTQLGSDALVDLYVRYWRFVAATAQRYSGYINRIEGDGGFLLFGYPEGGEDAAECSVRTCIDLIRGIASAVEVPSHSLALRVGAASGTIVIAGTIDASMNKQQHILGPVPDRAHRLTTLASPGMALIDADTRRLAGQFFSYRDAGQHSLKNLERPVHVWEVLGETSVVSRFDARHQGGLHEAVVPVGRADELQTIRTCWLGAQSGKGNVVWISGEPGIGKSSLARYFSRTLSEPAACLELQCMARAERSPLFPVATLLRRRAGFELGDTDDVRQAKARHLLEGLLPDAAVGDALGLLAALFGLPPSQQHAQVEPDALRERTIALLCDLFTAFTRGGAILLSCEDMHWADATTLSLLSRFAERAAQLPALLLFTSRVAPLSTRELGAPPFVRSTTIELQPLGAAQATELARSIAVMPPLSDEQVQAVVARAEGLPLIIEELAFSARQQEEAAAQDPAGLAGGSQQVVPEILKTIVQGRIDRAPSVIPVVHTAAVLGREFSLSLLMAAATEAGDIAVPLAEAIDLGLLYQHTTGGVDMLRFKHGLIQEAVYDSMLASRQKEIHSQVADLLKDGSATPEECTPDALAHHLLRAERFAQGVQCLCQAAFATALRAAYVESQAYAQQGLQWVGRVADAQVRAQLELQLLSVMGMALSAVRGYAAPEVEETYRKAHSLCSEGGDPLSLFPIARGLAAFYFVRGQMSTAGALAAQCVELAAKTGVPDFEVEALSILGYTETYLGRTREGRGALEESIRLGRHMTERFIYTTTQHPVTAALALLGNAAWAQGDTDLAEATVKEAIAFATQLNRPFDIAYAHGWASGLRNLQRRWPQAQAHAQQCVAVSEKYSLRIWLAAGAMQGCIAQASSAAEPQALQTLQATLLGFLYAGAEVGSGYFRWGIARGQRMAGDLEAARNTVAQALAHVDRTDDAFIRGELLVLAAELEEEPQRVQSLLLEAIQQATEVCAPTLALRAGLQLMRLRGLESGDPQRDIEARMALEGQSGRAPQGPWIHDAWQAVRAALELDASGQEAAAAYQRSPSSISSTIEH